MMTLSVDQIIKAIEKLPAAEQEKIRQWLKDKGANNKVGYGSQAHANRSAKSLRWLHENRDKYSDQWVALDGDRLIASGPTAKDVYSKAKAEGLETPFVELVTSQGTTPEAAALELLETAVLAQKPFEEIVEPIARSFDESGDVRRRTRRPRKANPKDHPRGETPEQIGDARTYSPASSLTAICSFKESPTVTAQRARRCGCFSMETYRSL